MQDWGGVDDALRSLVSSHAFPGATAIVADRSGLLHATAVGRHTYGTSAMKMELSTHFDMASLTKVLVTTTCAMLLYQWGELKLDAPVINMFGPKFSAADSRKGMITPRHLLLHEAGLPPDPTPVSYCAPSFACPEVALLPPRERNLTFSCRQRAFDHLVKSQTLDRAPGIKFVYSDISMITMMNVVGHLAKSGGHVHEHDLLPACVGENATASDSGGSFITATAQCYFEAFARTHIFNKFEVGRADTYLGFRLPKALWPIAAPTWNDTTSGFPGECVRPYRERVLQGEVSDGNAYSLGGVAGHAGLFASVRHVHLLMHEILFAPGMGALGITRDTVDLFTTVHNKTRSTRALGWDTDSVLCGNMSARTFTHTGYTGTMICADPDARDGGLLTVLLTNRVYPKADEASEERIHAARVRYNNAVLVALGGGAGGRV